MSNEYNADCRPVDIGDIIKFGNRNDNRLPHIPISQVLNVPVTVTGWEIKESRFESGNPDRVFVEMHVLLKGAEYRFNTGSGVIIDQLNEIHRAKPDLTQFDCIIRRTGHFYKMYPATDKDSDK